MFFARAPQIQHEAISAGFILSESEYLLQQLQQRSYFKLL